MVLVVTEPTMSGQHDLERVVELTSHFGIQTVVCINKYDINPEIAKSIEQRSEEMGVRVLGKLVYDEAVTKAQVAGQSIVEYSQGAINKQIVGLWQSVLEMLNAAPSTKES